MQNIEKKKCRSGWLMLVFIVWFIMNVRVAAGISSTFERAIDGMVGIAVLLAAVFLALDFFEIIGKKRNDEAG